MADALPTPAGATLATMAGALPGGDAGIRTPCLLRAKQALYQMSYIPSLCPAAPPVSYLRTGWWGILDSNQGLQSYQDCALTT
jgi:hypothetical protein